VHNDLTFITNDQRGTLKDRFATLISATKYFDVLVGYFYTSGFHAMYPALEETERIRILIGISTNRETFDLLQRVQSHKEVRDLFSISLKEEMELSENELHVEIGVKKFLEWLKSGKLEIRAYPEEKIHSKLYVMSFKDGQMDMGRVITGSSNFTQNGLVENLEFNVELKNRSDYEFARDKFEELWARGVDVSDKYVETIQKDTWLREDISPYELYLKFLYEYFKDEINEEALDHRYRPENFKELKYQDHAVINARKIVDEYGGVFLSDVVGLGKTFMGTMLCQELNRRVLVLAPPHLIDEDNPGSWENAFRTFGFRARDYTCRSIGVLDRIIRKNEHQDFDIVLIDEAHRFRSEQTETYAKLAEVCRGKKVILVTATPFNNTPSDLLAQIKLFQKTRQSTIPNLPDVEGFFKSLERKLKGLDRQADKKQFISITKENASLIRDRVLKHLMVRRTRKEISEYYGDDLRQQGMSFPEVAEPKPIFYEFNPEEDRIFFRTIELVTQDFMYARYTPMLRHKGSMTALERQSQQNMMKFMKMLLIKRLESSFFAFTQTLDRFIASYDRFIQEFEDGTVYVSAKHTHKIFEYLERGDLDGVDRLIEDGKAEKFPAEEFDEKLKAELYADRHILKEIKDMWKTVKRDPKILAFKDALQKQAPIHDGKSIIFTESKETADYLQAQLQKEFSGQIVCFTGSNSAADREEVIANFDANAKNPKDDYKLLITTDVLAEGANLHRANVVINYDIPWNPTRIMQRVGRINRVDTMHEKVHTYTFFPTDQSNDQIKLKEAAEAKIAAFISLLGSDARLLTESEEVEAHSLFSQLLSKETIEGQDEPESELKYLQEIRLLRDENPTLFEKVKRLPKKARTARKSEASASSLLTYFRKGNLQKFFRVSADDINVSEELDFLQAAQVLKADATELRSKLDKTFYKLLEKNSDMLTRSTEIEEEEFSTKRGSRDNAARLSKILKAKQVKNFQGFTDDDEEYIANVIAELDAGGIPKKISQRIHAKVERTPELLVNPLKLLALLKLELPAAFLQPNRTEQGRVRGSAKEIILSEYLNAEEK
jgi:superfamily II DNA or RNA helicase